MIMKPYPKAEQLAMGVKIQQGHFDKIDSICLFFLIITAILYTREKTTSQNSASGKYLVNYVKEYELFDPEGGVLE